MKAGRLNVVKEYEYTKTVNAVKDCKEDCVCWKIANAVEDSKRHYEYSNNVNTVKYCKKDYVCRKTVKD